MPALNRFHDAVKTGLVKDGWTITADPLVVKFGKNEMFIDLGAEKLVAAERDGQLIAVEIKSFLGPSSLAEFHLALGQFLNYRVALSHQDPKRVLYLAVPVEIYDEFFVLPLPQEVIRLYSLRLITYDAEAEALTQWIS